MEIVTVNFFTKIKDAGLFKMILKAQQASIEAIFSECQKQGVTDLRQIAYILATAYHESYNPKDPLTRLTPLEEIGKGAGRDYGKKLKYGNGPGKRVPYTSPDKIYYGRGFTQNTWYEIYENLTKANPFNWDFLNHPELLLSITQSAWATVYAMRKGLYTGRKLSDYINDQKTDFINARRIINGTDKAELIAGYASKFLQALN
jgi:hypothetical protein